MLLGSDVLVLLFGKMSWLNGSVMGGQLLVGSEMGHLVQDLWYFVVGCVLVLVGILFLSSLMNLGLLKGCGMGVSPIVLLRPSWVVSSWALVGWHVRLLFLWCLGRLETGRGLLGWMRLGCLMVWVVVLGVVLGFGFGFGDGEPGGDVLLQAK